LLLGKPRTVFLKDSVVDIDGVCRYTNGEAGVVDHGVVRRSALLSRNRESIIGGVAAGFGISLSFAVGAWSVTTRRDFSSSVRVEGDADLVACHPCYGQRDDVAMCANAFLVRGVLDAAHEGRSIRAELMPGVIVDAVV
jgi:hypothetical protein